MVISPARLTAFDILYKIESDRGHSSELLADFEDALSDKDSSLCHELTLGTLRRQIYLDRLLDLLSNGKKMDIAVRIAIRLGLYQILYLDRIPDYSAINDSVELVSRARKTSAKGLVNAILRRATREPVVLSFADDIERVSVETSHPRWLIEKWSAQFGLADAIELAHADNEKPRVSFRGTFRLLERELRTGNAGIFGEFQLSPFVEECYGTGQITPELRASEARAEIYFQDEASQLVARAVELDGNDRFIDICASPGSKTTAIAARYAAAGPRPLIVAGDINDTRVRFLKHNCAAQGVGFVICVQFDAHTPLPFPDESFNVILVDAPCTGTGTIRHNPEIRYRLGPGDFERSARKQKRIVENASRLLVRGGRLIYSTCSLEKEENEIVMASFLEDVEGFRIVSPKVPNRFLTSDGFARTFPHRDQMDGFFIAELEKIDRRVVE